MSKKQNAYEQITEQIIELLETGVVPWRRPWRADEMPTSGQTGKAYKGLNSFILYAAQGARGYKSRFWLTFKQAKDRGGYVRKGEKSIRVCFWKFFDEVDKNGDQTGKAIPMLKIYRVFNFDQCEGVELKNKEKELEAESSKVLDFIPIEEAERLAKWPGRPFKKPVVEHAGDRAYYRPSTDSVTMPPKEKFEGEEEYYSTLFHEFAHSTGHINRLHRDTITSTAAFGSATYSKEELIAEFSAAMMCSACNISNETVDNSAAYIKGWLRKLKSDPKVLTSAISAAKKATAYIIDPASHKE